MPHSQIWLKCSYQHKITLDSPPPISSQGVLCICSVWRQQSNILYDTWPEHTIQLVNHIRMKYRLIFPTGCKKEAGCRRFHIFPQGVTRTLPSLYHPSAVEKFGFLFFSHKYCNVVLLSVLSFHSGQQYVDTCLAVSWKST